MLHDKQKIKMKCNHTFDGGCCLKCGKKSLCEIYKENVWENKM